MNFTVSNAASCIERVQKHFLSKAVSLDKLDGLSMSFDVWRFNLRMSNTEPLVRLNVESKGDPLIIKEKTEELKNLIMHV